jgi:DNA-binding NtrC family response regulator
MGMPHSSIHQRDLLIVSARKTDHTTFERTARRIGSEARHCDSVEAALPLIKGADIIVCDEDLGDSEWKLLLERSRAARSRPKFILISRATDGSTFPEALNIGAYDVLAKPLNSAATIWVLDSARPVPARTAWLTHRYERFL